MEILSNIASFIYNIIIFGIVFGISYSISIFYMFNGLVPLLWLPYVSYKILKKDLKPAAIFNCIIAPIVWNILFIILGFISVKFAPIGKIINILFFSIAGILGGIFALIQVFTNMFSAQAREEFLSGISKSKMQQKIYDEDIAKLVGYTYSFVYSNTQGLEDYGLENGYIPNNYINDFKKVFSKTVQNVEIIKNEYLEKLSDEEKRAISEELEKMKECFAIEDKNTWEDAYIRNTGKEKTRKEFLMDVETCKDTIIQNHVQSFKRRYPSIFID